MALQEIPDDQKLPVSVITGFLGAGKTTLLNHILTKNHGMKYAIIENEFGEIGIDTDLVQTKENLAEEIISMDNGCLCCTVRDDLVKGIRKILDAGKNLDGIIIETTGMADPAPVVQTFYQSDDLRARCRVDGIITVVDSKHVSAHLFDDQRSEGSVNEAMQQVAFADRIILNKTDLISENELLQLKHDIKSINKIADHLVAVKSVVDPKLLIGINRFSLDRALEIDPDFLDKEDHHGGSHGHSHNDEDGKDHSKCDQGHGECDHGHSHEHRHSHSGKDHSNCDHEKGKCDHSHGHGHSHGHKEAFKPKTRHDVAVSSVGIKLNPGEHMSLDKLQEWIGEMLKTKNEDMYRYKGIISIKGFAEKFVFQGVHSQFDYDLKGEWEEPEDQRVSKFVFIGRKLNRDDLVTGFRKCIVQDLRFQVGQTVEAKVKAGWTRGEIIRVWERRGWEIQPYRIRLQTGIEVYGPIDDDRFVRLPLTMDSAS